MLEPANFVHKLVGKASSHCSDTVMPKYAAFFNIVNESLVNNLMTVFLQILRLLEAFRPSFDHR
jgi:hypothetical protein